MKETREPIRLTLAPGETDSAVIFIRNLLDQDIVVNAGAPHAFTSDRGEEHMFHGSYRARFFRIRAAEMVMRRLTAKRYVYAPKYLLNSTELTVWSGHPDRQWVQDRHQLLNGTELTALPGHGGQFWMTATVPSGTPPGEYVGEVKITRITVMAALSLTFGDFSPRLFHVDVVATETH